MVLYVTAVLRRSLTVRPFITGEILPFLLLIGRTIFVILIGHISAVTQFSWIINLNIYERNNGAKKLKKKLTLSKSP